MRRAAVLAAATLSAAVLTAPAVAMAASSPSPAYPPATSSPSPSPTATVGTITVTVTVSQDGKTITVTVSGVDPGSTVTITVTVTSTSQAAFHGNQTVHVVPAAFAAGSTASKQVTASAAGTVDTTYSPADFGLSTFQGNGTVTATATGTKNGVSVTGTDSTTLASSISESRPAEESGSAAASPVTTSGSLPFTGATAIVPTALVGVLLVGAGATAIVASRRRERSRTSA